MRREVRRFVHGADDALKLFFAVSTYALHKITDLGASDSLTFLAIFCVRLTVDSTNWANYFRSRFRFRLSYLTRRDYAQ